MDSKATNVIATVVLSVFSLLLITVLIKAITLYACEGPDCGAKEGKVWLDIFKDGFILLGGAFTTLIGYYFGTRGSDQTLSKAEDIKAVTDDLLDQLAKESPTSSEDDDDIESLS